MEQLDTIDSYTGTFPAEVGTILERLRQTIREAAPEAREGFSYRIPTFKLNGNLVHFAGFKSHIGFYPAPSGIEAFREELKDFKVSKGAIQFPLDKPIPFDLVRRIVEFRVKEQRAK
jgi:uncharacterized protein YdhG (YjbR/CyaY superfamily)